MRHAGALAAALVALWMALWVGVASATPLDVERWESPTGAQVLVSPSDGEYVAFIIALGYGAAHDPPHLAGLAMLHARMLLRGEARREVEDRLAALGARLEVEVTSTATLLHGEVLAAQLEPCLALTLGLLSQPRFDAEGIAEVARELDAERALEQASDGALIYQKMRSFIYQDHPLGQPPEGYAHTVARIDLETLRETHRKRVGARALWLAFAGDVESGAVREALGDHLEGLPEGASPRAIPSPEIAEEGRQVLLVDKAHRTQNHLLIVHPTPAASHPDFLALQLLAVVLGEGPSSRLYRRLRVEEGWTYGIQSELSVEPLSARLTTWTFTSPDRVLDALEVILSEIEELRRGGIDAATFEAARRWMLRRAGQSRDSPEARVRWLVRGLIAGHSLEAMGAEIAQLEALELEDVQRAAQQHLGSARQFIVIVCTARHYQQVLFERLDVRAVVTHEE